MFRKPEELMPPSCLFDRLDRGEADRSVSGGGYSIIMCGSLSSR